MNLLLSLFTFYTRNNVVALLIAWAFSLNTPWWVPKSPSVKRIKIYHEWCVEILMNQVILALLNSDALKFCFFQFASNVFTINYPMRMLIAAQCVMLILDVFQRKNSGVLQSLSRSPPLASLDSMVFEKCNLTSHGKWLPWLNRW